jgi:hypothetical protein
VRAVAKHKQASKQLPSLGTAIYYDLLDEYLTALSEKASGSSREFIKAIDPGRLGVEEVGDSTLLIEWRQHAVLSKELVSIQVLDAGCLLDELACKS